MNIRKRVIDPGFNQKSYDIRLWPKAAKALIDDIEEALEKPGVPVRRIGWQVLVARTPEEWDGRKSK